MKSVRNAGTIAALTVALMMIGCGGADRNRSDGSSADDRPATPMARGDAEPGTATAATRERTLLFLGTSLTAGYGLRPHQAYPALVQAKIDSVGLPFRVVNAGVSGETSAGALRRIDWLLQQPYDVLVIETGSNDMLRGTDPTETERNIQTIIDRARERRPEATILLAGMLALPNLGREYGRQFEAIYPRLAERNRLILIPFLLEGVAGERPLNLEDGVHPNAEGQRMVAETVWRVLAPELHRQTPQAEG